MEPTNPNQPFNLNPPNIPNPPIIPPTITPPPFQPAPMPTPPPESPVMPPPVPPKKGSSFGSILLSLIMLVIVAGLFYYLGTQKLFGEVPIPLTLKPTPVPLVKSTPNSTPIVTPVPTAEPEATAAADIESSPSAGMITYTNPRLGFSIKFSDTLEINKEDLKLSSKSVSLMKKGSNIQGIGETVFYVSVIPDGFDNKDVSVYNFINSNVIDSFFALKVGDSKSSQEPPSEYFTYTKLPDITVGGQKAIVMQNDKPWATIGTKERRVFVKQGTTNYMIGVYYETQSTLDNFQTFLKNFKFTK